MDLANLKLTNNGILHDLSRMYCIHDQGIIQIYEIIVLHTEHNYRHQHF